MNNEIKINSTGSYLKNSKFSMRMKNLAFSFSDKIVSWDKEVYKELPDRIGVYAILNQDDDIIYVGKATGVGGLKQRHRNHEKNLLFKLFDANKLMYYHVEDNSTDDPGIVVLLERMLIYAHDPLLNDDIKGSVPITHLISNKIITKIDDLIVRYTVNGSDEVKYLLNAIYEELDSLRKASEEALSSYNEAIKQFNNEVINEFKTTMKECNKNLKTLNDQLLKELDVFPNNP
ncbi:hypothetical protein [Psychrobacillus sp. FSL K6-1267]|uniref:hypothetical protein n=1 Tax=Psychrobacillus sp. FSL K6-1267 TaxID=2921543 RepID=UPI0030FBD4C1